MADRLAKLEKAYRRNPDSPLFARLADLYLKRGKTEEALEVCLRGCQHFPDYATGFMVLAQCYEVQGAIEQARDAIDQSLRLDPVNPRGYCRLSAIYEKLGVPTLALKSLQQAAELDPLAEELPSQVDELSYKVRLEASRRAERGPVEPFVDAAAGSTAQALNNDPVEASADEQTDEPFAQVSPQGEWADEPDVGAVLQENEPQFDEPFGQEESPVDAASDDAPAERVDDPDPAEEHAVGDVASDEDTGWVRYEPTQDAEAEGADEEISIFSPDNLPEDADIFQPQPSDLPAEAAGIQMPEIDEDEGEEAEVEEAAPAGPPAEADLPESAEAEQDAKEKPGDEAAAAERQPQVGERYGEFDRETFAVVLSALKGSDPPPASPAASVDDGDESFGAPVAAGESAAAADEEKTSRDESEQGAPPVDFGSLIAAMEGMGSEERSPANAETESEPPPEASLVADDEPFVLRDDPVEETVADDEPFVLRDDPVEETVASDAAEADKTAVSDGELAVADPVAGERPEQGGELDRVEPLDLSDLRAPAQDQEPADPQPLVDAQEADDELEPASDAGEGADEETGRGAGLRARGDDELLRLFQEIETQGQDDGDSALELGPEQVSTGQDGVEEDEDRQRITTLTLAEIYAIQGLNQKAIETYRDLLEQDPENDFIRRKLQDLENNSGKK